MSERVNIQYSVDIEDLGEEVCRLICTAFENLNALTPAVATPGDNVLSLQTIQQIDEVRQQLGEIDIRLGDAISLINGYVSYKSQSIDHQQVSAQIDREREPNNTKESPHTGALSALSALQDQIEGFQAEK
tara:strand:- start:1143 stop:1535 length:393 start_codon:yes stop_codon:yes gene_type:complete